MKTTSRRIFGALLGLCVLSVIAPGVRADETADWMAEMRRQNDEFNRQAQADREAMDKFNREAQEAREAMDRFNREAQADREARDKFNREAQEERDARDKWNREVQEGRDNERKQQEWDDWLNRLTGSAGAVGLAAAGPTSTPPKAPVVRPNAPVVRPNAPVIRPAPALQVRVSVPAAPQRRPVPQDPVAFRRMVLQNQARVRQQIMQTRQQMMLGLRSSPN